MPQKLNIEIASSFGEKTYRQVEVIRSWQDISGGQILLFSNGSYGYRNGEPVRSANEFAIITSPVQNKAAMAWWNRAGREISIAYYAAKERREAELQGDFQASVGSDSQMDTVLYTRAPRGDANDVSGPFSWMDLFPKRPDWWGQAEQIVFGDYVYSRADAAAAGPPATVDEGEHGIAKVESVKKKAIPGRRSAYESHLNKGEH